MIRTFVLTLTFVQCRIAMQFPLFDLPNLEGITATVWVSWTVPLLITEIILQCGKTAKEKRN